MSEEQTTPMLPEMTLEEAITEIERLTKENAEYLDGWKRMKADYANLKSEQERRGKELAQFAGLSIIMQLLPVQEYFRQALEHMPADIASTEWAKGIQQIYKQMKESMKTLGLEEFRAEKGSEFDPARHEAVGQESVAEFGDDVVTQEASAGYSLHGKVISPAKVVLNKKPA